MTIGRWWIKEWVVETFKIMTPLVLSPVELIGDQSLSSLIILGLSMKPSRILSNMSGRICMLSVEENLCCMRS